VNTLGKGSIAYTYDERRLMARLHDDGWTVHEIADALTAIPGRPRRTGGAVKTQLSLMGVLPKRADRRRRVKDTPERRDVVRRVADRYKVPPPPAEPPGRAYVSTISPVPLSRLMAGR